MHRARRVATAAIAAAAVASAAGCARDGEATTPTVAPAVVEEVDCGVADEPREIPSITPPAETPTSLVLTELRSGTGRPARDGDTLYVDFVGIRVEDGTAFDASYDRPVPFDFALGGGRVMAGWDDGLVGATAGSMVRLDVPADLAYGDNPPGPPLEPGDALSFVIEVRAVVPPTTGDDAPLDLDVESSVGATDVTSEDLVVGDGEVLQMGDTAIVQALLVRGDNRIVLLNTWERSEPLLIELSDPPNAMPGLVQGLQCARVGGRRLLTLPPAWAFGEEGNPSIGLPADTDLIVVAEVVGAY